MDLRSRTIRRFFFHFSVSSSALASFKLIHCGSSLVNSTVEALNCLGALNTLTLFWVPGHDNIRGNERADALANMGSDSRPIGPEPFLMYSFSHIRGEFINRLAEIHLKEFNKTPHSDRGKTPIREYLLKYSYSLALSSRSQLSSLTRILSGHNELNYFNHKIRIALLPFCPHCPRSLETSVHFLCTCPAYSHLRFSIFSSSSLAITDLIINYKISQILAFIRRTNRFDNPEV